MFLLKLEFKSTFYLSLVMCNFIPLLKSILCPYLSLSLNPLLSSFVLFNQFQLHPIINLIQKYIENKSSSPIYL
jgi:hypothetical protein